MKIQKIEFYQNCLILFVDEKTYRYCLTNIMNTGTGILYIMEGASGYSIVTPRIFKAVLKELNVESLTK